MKTQKLTTNKQRLREIRRNNCRMWQLWFTNLSLWIAIFANISARAVKFLYKWRRLIARCTISITLLVSTILSVGTFAVLTVFRILIGFVQSEGYAYGWKDFDVANYQRLQDLKEGFLHINPVATLMSNMGSTMWGSILRMLLPFVVVALSYLWFFYKPCKRKRRASRKLAR